MDKNRQTFCTKHYLMIDGADKSFCDAHAVGSRLTTGLADLLASYT